jgi:hypothetical protein
LGRLLYSLLLSNFQQSHFLNVETGEEEEAV